MTTATKTAPPYRRGLTTSTAPRVTFGGVLASEWTKLLTLRSTGFIVLAALLVSLAGSWLQAIRTTSGGAPASDLAAVAATARVLHASTLGGQLVIAVLAVLIVSSEYSTGMITTTFASVPRRLPVLAAKAIVVAVTSVALAIVADVLAYAATISRLNAIDLGASLVNPGVLRGIAGDALSVLIVALFALLLTTVVRNTAAGIAIVMAVLFVLPTVLSFTIGDTGVSPSQFTLTYAAQMTTTALAHPEAVTHLAFNIAVLAAWIGGPALAGVLLLQRRDA